MFSCSRNETQLIQDGIATSVTRQYPAGHPHKVGAQIIFTSSHVSHGDGEVPFAVGRIISIRPSSVAEMRRDERLCRMDGFRSCAEWFGHFKKRYPVFSDDTPVVRLQFKIEEMDKDVASKVSRPVEQTEID